MRPFLDTLPSILALLACQVKDASLPCQLHDLGLFQVNLYVDDLGIGKFIGSYCVALPDGGSVWPQRRLVPITGHD